MIKRKCIMLKTRYVFTLLLSILLLNGCSSLEKPNPGALDRIEEVELIKDLNIEDLRKDQVINDYIVQSVYLNHRGTRMGGRFIHQPTNMPLDILRINTVPQMLITVSTLAQSDKGEAHTGEHLVLGKGAKGASMSLAMGMMLGSFSAGTHQDVTAYHFNTVSGEEAYFNLMHSFLDTLINPDFTDEEIRREVCHLGVNVDPKEKTLFLDEKGTIYNEMLSSSEKPSFHAWRELKILLYGQNHPLSYVAGGLPESIREMTPEDIFSFHHNRYQFGPTTNSIVVIPPEFSLIKVLDKINTIISSIRADEAYDQKHGKPLSMPTFEPDQDKETIRISSYPGKPGMSDGFTYLSWGPFQDISQEEIMTLELIFELLAEGESSYLYNDLIDGRTRTINPAPTEIAPFTYHIDGYPVFLYISGFPEHKVDEEYLSRLRSIVQNRIEWLANLPDNSDDLEKVNQRFQILLNSRIRQLRKRVEDNPGFGGRGTGIWWHRYLKNLNQSSGFEIDLIPRDYLKFLEEKLSSSNNFYLQYLDKFNLRKLPYMVSAVPSEDMMNKERQEKRERMQRATQALMTQYNKQNAQDALQQLSQEIVIKTKELDERDRALPTPSFSENPPLVYDTGIVTETELFEGNVPCVWNYFDSLSFHNTGLHFDLSTLSSEHLPFLVILPELLVGSGVINSEGQIIPFDEMSDLLRNEINYLTFQFDSKPETGRIELAIAASGGSVKEGRLALEWLEHSLFRPLITIENSTRIADMINQKLSQLKNTMNYPEEYWISDVTQAVYYHGDQLNLITSSLMTQIHALQRLAWKMIEPPDNSQSQYWKLFLDKLERTIDTREVEEFKTIFKHVRMNPGQSAMEQTEQFEQSLWINELVNSLKPILNQSKSTKNQYLVDQLFSALEETTLFSPLENRKDDCHQVINEFKEDVWLLPSETITALQKMRYDLIDSCPLRIHFTGNKEDKEKLNESLKKLVVKICSNGTSDRGARYDIKSDEKQKKSSVMEKLAQRYPQLAKKNELPPYVAFVKQNTKNAVFTNRAPGWTVKDLSRKHLLKQLSVGLYSGAGSHAFFMQTWGQGLAYSNSVYHSNHSGTVNYYAERCSDVVALMKFLTSLLKKSPEIIDSPYFLEYSLANYFGFNLTAKDYFLRGKKMSDYLAEGTTPEIVRQFRQSLLALRHQQDIVPKLVEMLPHTIGPVIVGYGEKANESPGTTILLTGPESQIKQFEDYVGEVEGETIIYRLYPRDFWL